MDSRTSQSFCQWKVPVDDLVRRLRLVRRKTASCVYSFGSEFNRLSPRSDVCSLADIVEVESRKLQITSPRPGTAGLTVQSPRASTSGTSGWTFGSVTVGSGSALPAPENAASAKIWIWRSVVVVAACGITICQLAGIRVLQEPQKSWFQSTEKTRVDEREKRPPASDPDVDLYSTVLPH
ncbi:uncharacterized protein ACBR49_009130 [Aulostomus maculatus]